MITSYRKKTILFGAGTAASQIILFDNTVNVIAIADNDRSKIGSVFHGVPVVTPDYLQQAAFDEVMITTGNITAARQQLLTVLGVSEEKIVLPRKHLTKSLETLRNAENYHLANTLLSVMTSADFSENMGVAVDLDTLRNLVASGLLSQACSLLQLSLPMKNLNCYAEYLAEFLSELANKERFSWQLIPMNNSTGVTIAYVLEVNRNGRENERFSFIFRGFIEINNYVIDVPGRAMYFAPIHLREQTCLITFSNLTYRVPLYWEEYLTFIFDDWQNTAQTTRLYEYRHRGFCSLPTDKQLKFKESLPWVFEEHQGASVVLVVYNNADCLARAIESVLLQALPLHLAVYCIDDASNDGSTELLHAYKAKFTESVFLSISAVNQGAGKKSLLLHRPEIKSLFWAFLSGDDYWLTQLNLWFQSDYLLNSTDAIACACTTIMQDESSEYESIIRPQLRKWNIFDLLLFNRKYRLYTHTSSILWRNIFYKKRGFFLPEKFEHKEAHGDVMLAHFMLEEAGEMHRIDRIMNFYRYSGKGVWSSLSKQQQIDANEKMHGMLNRMISVKVKILCGIYKSSLIPPFLKRLLTGPLNER